MALIADELRGLMSLMTLGAGDRAKVRVVVIDIAAGCLLSKLFIASAMTLEAVLRREKLRPEVRLQKYGTSCNSPKCSVFSYFYLNSSPNWKRILCNSNELVNRGCVER